MKKRTKKKLIVVAVGVAILCILAMISQILERPKQEKDENATSQEFVNTTTEPTEAPTEPDSESAENQSAEETEAETESETEEGAENESKTEEEELEQPIYEQAELPEVRQGLEVYCTIKENPVWDVPIHTSMEEAKANAYTIQEIGEKRFCISGFESAVQVIATIMGANGNKIPLTYDYFGEEGVYSFEANFLEPDTYVVQLTYVVGNIQDIVYLGLKFQ